MKSTVNEVICKCKHVTMIDIEKALHSHSKFEDVEKEFDEVQKITVFAANQPLIISEITSIILS